MTVCLVNEGFPPPRARGATWRSAVLSRHGERVIVVTPNVGAAAVERQDDVTIDRGAVPVKVRPGRLGA